MNLGKPLVPHRLESRRPFWHRDSSAVEQAPHLLTCAPEISTRFFLARLQFAFGFRAVDAPVMPCSVRSTAGILLPPFGKQCKRSGAETRLLLELGDSGVLKTFFF